MCGVEPGLLNNREAAGLLWVAVVGGFVLTRPNRQSVLRSLGGVFRTLVGPKLLLPLFAYGAWLTAAVWLASTVGLWTADLVKPTVLWGLFAGLAFYFNVTKPLKEDAYFKRAFIGAIGASALVEFVVNLKSFPLAVELITQPLVAVLAMTAIVARQNPEQQIVVKVSNVVTAGYGLMALAWATWSVLSNWHQVATTSLALELLMPVWLTPVALGFVYVLAIVMAYESAFMRIDWNAKGRSTWRLKAALLLTARLRLRVLRRLPGRPSFEASRKTTFGGARRVFASEAA